MKEKQKKSLNDKKLEAHWEKVAAAYEDPVVGLKMLEQSRVLSPTEARKILGKSRTKAISVRIPEEDLSALRKIAQSNNRKYQQLIVIAIEQYIDQFHMKKAI